MTLADRFAQRIRKGEPLPPGIGPILEAATVGVRAGMWWRKRRLVHRVDAQVVSYGNLTAGGTGKTPAVIERAQQELAAGRPVAVVTRGYRSPGNPPEPWIAPPAAHAYEVFEQVGDEAALVHMKAPGVRIVKAANRVAGARAAIEQARCDTVLLDDGFQAVYLARDENMLMIDATNPFGNGRLIPRGVLREPPAAAARATAVYLSHCDQADELETVHAAVKELCPHAAVRFTYHAPVGLWRVSDGDAIPLDALHDAPVTLACALAQPERFEITLRSIGAEPIAFQVAPDHVPLDPRDWGRKGLIIVTEKDAVRMPNAPDNVYALAIELRDWAPQA